MDPDAELLEPTTPDGSEDGEGPEEAGEAGELDYEPSEPDAASPADLIRYQESFDEGDHGSRMDEQSGEQQPNDEETEDGEIDDLEDGEVKDDDDDEPLPPPQFFNRRSPPSKLADSQPLPPLSALPPPRLPATGQSPGFGLAPSVRPEDVGICKFYLRGQCTWGTTCKFMHPQGQERSQWRQTDPPQQQPARTNQWTNSGNNTNNPRRVSVGGSGGGRPLSLTGGMQRRAPQQSQSFPPVSGPPVPLLLSAPPPVKESDESAWERGLKQARELMKKANEKREKEPDFEEKRLVLPPSDEMDIRKSTGVYDEPDSDGENDRRVDRDIRRSGSNYEPVAGRERGGDRRRQTARDDDIPPSADRSRNHNHPPPKIYRGTSQGYGASNRSDSTRERDHYDRRPVLAEGPQVLYPSQRNYTSSTTSRSSGTRDSGRSRTRTDGAVSSSRVRESGRVGERDRTSRDAPTRDRDDDRRRSGDHRSSGGERGGGRPLPYDRPSYDGRGEYRDPWERDRRNPPTTATAPPARDRPVTRKRSTSSVSTFSSKRSKSSSRSKSRDTYSSSRSSASPETRSRKRKERSSGAPKVSSDSLGRIPKLTKDTAKAVDGAIVTAVVAPTSRQRRSISPMTPPSYEQDPLLASRLSPDEEVDDRQPIKMTIKPKSKVRQYSKTELDSSPSPSRSTGAGSGDDMDEPSAKKAKTGEKKDKDTRREELLKQLRSVEEAIAKKRTKSITSD